MTNHVIHLGMFAGGKDNAEYFLYISRGYNGKIHFTDKMTKASRLRLAHVLDRLPSPHHVIYKDGSLELDYRTISQPESEPPMDK